MGYCVLPNGTSFLASKFKTSQNNLSHFKIYFQVSAFVSLSLSRLPSKLNSFRKRSCVIRLYFNFKQSKILIIVDFNKQTLIVVVFALFQTCSFSSFLSPRLALSKPTFLGVGRLAKVSIPCANFAPAEGLLTPPRTCSVRLSASVLRARGPEPRQGRIA